MEGKEEWKGGMWRGWKEEWVYLSRLLACSLAGKDTAMALVLCKASKGCAGRY